MPRGKVATLAAEPRSEESGEHQFLTFFLKDEEYGIAIMKVREIVAYSTVTRVPGMPAIVRGVMNLRGSVVPVVDLGRKFGLPEGPVTKRTCIVIVEVVVEGEPTVIGIVADSVSQVMRFGPEDIEAPPPLGTSVRQENLLGLGRLEQRFVILLDVDRALSAGELPGLARHPAVDRVLEHGRDDAGRGPSPGAEVGS